MRKCSLVFTPAPHGHIGLTMSFKPCLNLCSFKWLNRSLKYDSNFAPFFYVLNWFLANCFLFQTRTCTHPSPQKTFLYAISLRIFPTISHNRIDSGHIALIICCQYCTVFYNLAMKHFRFHNPFFQYFHVE